MDLPSIPAINIPPSAMLSAEELIVLNAGDTLTVDPSNTAEAAPPIVLAGGTLEVPPTDTPTEYHLGPLSLTQSSTIVLNPEGEGNVLRFSSLEEFDPEQTLTILNWRGFPPSTEAASEAPPPAPESINEA